VRRLLFLALLTTAGCVPDYSATGSNNDAAPNDTGASDASPTIDAGDASHPQDTGTPIDASDAAPPGTDAGVDAGSIVCHSGNGSTYTYCAVGTQACCGVFAPVPDFCVPFPDTNNACKSGASPVALISCTDQNQCNPGDVCCAQNLDLGAQTYSAIACAPQGVCSGTSGVACGTILGAPDNATCTGGKSCTGVIDLYRFCQ